MAWPTRGAFPQRAANNFKYLAPRARHDALAALAASAALAQPGAVAVAGGTNLLDLMKEDVARPATLVHVNGLPLRAIATTPDVGLWLGALARNVDTAHHPLVRAPYPVLSAALLAGASPQIRNLATNGGAFGSGLRPQYQLVLAVMAALHLARSTRVVLTRQQMFIFGHRPETWQHVKLAANQEGALQAVVHDAVAATSRLEDDVEVVVNWSGQLYRCDNLRLGYQVVDLDQYSPMDMRAPGAAHRLFALEVAMDELAHALVMDPVALRPRNHAERDGNKNRPFSSKDLEACYAQGARRFGWSQRQPRPRSQNAVP